MTIRSICVETNGVRSQDKPLFQSHFATVHVTIVGLTPEGQLQPWVTSVVERLLSVIFY